MTIAVNKLTSDKIVRYALATAQGSTTNIDVAIGSMADAVIFARARVALIHQTTNHVDTSGGFHSEAVFQVANVTLSVPTAMTSSNNPATATTTTFVASHAQALNIVNETAPTVTWSASGSNMRLTITRAGTGGTADIAAYIEYDAFLSS